VLRDCPERRTPAIQEIDLEDYPNGGPEFEARGQEYEEEEISDYDEEVVTPQSGNGEA
jgi:hypothetical protein